MITAVALRVSLVDTKTRRVLNTISITDPLSEDDAFDIPFKVLTPGPYKFNARTRRPAILNFQDYDGDGRTIEFVLFDAISCSDLFGTLIGYSMARDVVFKYEIQDGAFVTTWERGLFSRKPVGAGVYRYTIGNPPGPPEHCTARYLPGREQFEVRCTTTPPSSTPGPENQN